jgi:membrane associated rhomboid family serine protease
MRYEEDDGFPMFTFAMMAVLIAFFAAQFKGFDLTKFYEYPWRVADGQAWRLVTSTFLHGSVIHILFNLSLFFRLSRVVDNWLGPWAAMLLYSACAVSSGAAQLLVSPVGAIGASGVVYGFFGFLWVMSRRRDDAAEAVTRHTIETMLGWLGVCAVVNLFGGSIGNTAHIWGLLVGWMVGQCFVARRKVRPWMIVATAAVWALPVVLVQRPVWEATLGRVPFVNRGYGLNASPGMREAYEDPENQPQPGIFGFGERRRR